MIDGQHFEDLLASGIPFEQVLALAVAAADMRAVPDFEPDTEKDFDPATSATLPAIYSR